MERGHWISLTGTLLATAALLWNIHATGRQLEMSRRTLQLSQQAWLAPSVQAVALDPPSTTDSQRFELLIGWRNTGHGPALSVKSTELVNYDPTEDEIAKSGQTLPNEVWTGKATWISSGILGPGDTVVTRRFSTYGHPPGTRAIPGKVDIDTIIIEGRADYNDVLGYPHSTTYCWEGRTDGFDFSPCGKGNSVK
jgi:hypothetical protein